MFCTKCGSELPEGVRYCYVCGAAVRQLPPLRTGQGFAAGQPGQNTPAPPPSGMPGTGGHPAQPQSGPAYQASASSAPGAAYTAGPPPSATAYQANPPQSTISHANPPASPAYHYPAYHHPPAAGTPDTVGVLDWLLSTLLVLFVPVVRFIMLCVWAFGAGAKPSKRSWARAMLILFVVFYILFFALCVYYAAADPGFPYS